MSRHRPPPPPPRFTWLAKPTAAVAAVLSTASLGILWHGTWEATAQPVTVAAPTAVELPREPSGHGGPLTAPTFADPHVWTPSKGPVIVNGQALARPTVVLAPAATEAAPEPTPQPVAPTVVAASTPTVEPEPTPVDEPTDEPVVTEPDVTEPVETTPTETTEPTTEASETAEPTATLVVEVGS